MLLSVNELLLLALSSVHTVYLLKNIKVPAGTRWGFLTWLRIFFSLIPRAVCSRKCTGVTACSIAAGYFLTWCWWMFDFSWTNRSISYHFLVNGWIYWKKWKRWVYETYLLLSLVWNMNKRLEAALSCTWTHKCFEAMRTLALKYVTLAALLCSYLVGLLF